jgi:RNA polymerase sigma-70 factor (ECF subfamily)
MPPVETLYRSHGSAILRRARDMLGCEAEAQEVLHDVFASLLQHPDQFCGHSSAMTYLYRMTTNAALARIRSQRNRRRLLRTHHDRHVTVVGQAQEAHAELRELLRRLPAELAQLATYYYLDEMTQDEIAAMLGCSRQWVGKLLCRLRRHQEGAA